ncbi:MAG: two-component regulator propeller domain-containing protein, partial [Saprospiraceae bacterium]|nr:two-component regulator propeller domain-containing protein [Saprospiraceae bacterium]
DTLHSIFGNNIQSPFYEDSDQNIWFSTYDGINCYIRQHDHFIHDTIMVGGRSVEGYYVAHLESDSILWLMIQFEGVYQYNIKTKEKKWLHGIFNKAQRLKVLADKTSGKIKRSFLYAQGGAGLQMFDYPSPGDYSKFKSQTFFDGSSDAPLSQSMLIFDVLAESDTLVWLATQQGIMSFNPMRKSLQLHGQFPGVIDIEPYKNEYFLLSSLNNGIAVFDKKTRQILVNYRQEPNAPYSLRSNSTSSVYVDKDGIIWASVADKGIDFAHPDYLKFDLLLAPSESAPWKEGKITYLAEDRRGRIWCGTSTQGVLVLTPEGNLMGTFTSKNSDLVFDAIISILPDNRDRIWILTWGGVSLYNLRTKAFEKVAPANEVFFQGTQLKDGRILLCNFNGGIYEVMKHTKEGVQLKKIESIKSKKTFSSLYEDKNNKLWTSENSAGIKVFDPQDSFKLIDSLPFKGIITRFYEDPDSSILWIASSNGLVKYNQETREIKVYDRNAGLASQEIQSMLPDDKGNLWLSTSRGLIRFNRKSKEVKNFTLADGLSAAEFLFFSALKAGNSKLWFGSVSGITRFNPQELKMLPPTQKAQITGIMVNDEILDSLICQETQATNVGEMRKIVLKHHQNVLTFEFAALEYSDPENCRFEYKLEEYDERWVGPIEEGRVRYTNLPPGNYTFKVRVINSDGIKGTETTDLNILILKPWWTRWWALILEILLGLILLLIIIYFILRPGLAVAEVRQRISADLHDEIGSALTAIKIASNLALSGPSSNDACKEAMGRIAEISGETLDKMRDIIWANNPDYNPLEDIILRMRTVAQQTLPENMKLEINSGTIPMKEKIPGDKRYHMHLIFKETLINAVKYSKASTIKVNLTKQQRNLVLKIADNGEGFPEEEIEENGTSGKNGLRNMQDRAQKLHGTIDIASVPKKGVTVLLNFPTRETLRFRFSRLIKRIINLFYPLK